MHKENSLKALQRTELEILKTVVDYCNENDIKYYMIGGTLLGAVRHKGFIPWDDDIDIGMMRKDYDRFIQLWQDMHPSDLVMQNKETDERVHVSYTKIRKKGTRIIEKETMNSGIFKGVFIDVFPLDNILHSDNMIKDIEYLIFNYLASVSLYKNGYRLYKRKIIQNISAISSIMSFQFINMISRKIMTRHKDEDTEYVTSYASGYGYKKQRMSKMKIYGEGAFLPFEEHVFRAPVDYIGYLEQLFGDYLTLPPEHTRGLNHSFIEVDLENE
jgi:lipopolysaccharide cholinephosphotransferase